MNIQEITKVLSTVIHPENDKSVVELGLVQNLKVMENYVSFRLVFKRSDPMSASLKSACVKALKEAFPGVDVDILVLVDAGGATAKKKAELGKEELENVAKVIAVASGKGGVGKSTVAVNLAVALAKKGYKVGLLDADVYGPSVPKMTGTEDILPEMIQVDSPLASDDPSSEHYNEKKNLMVPVEKYGVKWISIGYFAKPEQALIWRGPLACGALKQLAYEVYWGELDYLLIDLPPGTGDIHISMISEIDLAGAIIVTTPQNVALADVEKGINMFANKDVQTPILGIVENMSWFTPAELPDNKYFIFGKDGGKKMAEKYNVPLLAQIPIVQSVMEGGDKGTPAALEDNTIVSDAFAELAGKIEKNL
ncbi:MAG: P-loop NTPase [Candidatus Egerieousia sp.]